MVVIVTDSSSDIPQKIIDDLGIHVLPATIMFGNKKLVDGVDITTKEFFDRLGEDYFHPVTLPASPLDFFKVFRDIEIRGEDILVVTLPESLSKFQISARIGAETIKSVRLEIFSSGGTSGFQGLLAIQAARLAKNRLSIDEIINNLEMIKKRTTLYAVVPSTESLVRGGRLNVTRGKLASLLGVFPILTVDDDHVVPFETGRGFAKSFEIILQSLHTQYSREEPLMAVILDAYNSLEANKLISQVQENFNVAELIYSKVGATIGVHVGRKAVALAISPIVSDLIFN